MPARSAALCLERQRARYARCAIILPSIAITYTPPDACLPLSTQDAINATASSYSTNDMPVDNMDAFTTCYVSRALLLYLAITPYARRCLCAFADV